MEIVEDDGSYITFEHFAPKWTVAEVTQMHHDRIAKLIAGHGVTVLDADWEPAELDRKVSGAKGTYRRLTRAFIAEHWHVLTDEELELIATENAGDHRQRIGCNRADGKAVQSTTQRRPYEWLADRYGIPTNDTAAGPWRRLVREAVLADETKGTVGDED